MPNYIALIRKDPDSIYGVDFPDFPGCISAGDTLEEAKEMAHEALEMHIEGMLEDGDPIPGPSSLEKVMSNTENQDAVAFLVFVASRKSNAKRINITFPEDVLEKVDIYVKGHPRLNRSKFLVKSAEEALGRREGALRDTRKQVGKRKPVKKKAKAKAS